MGPMGCPETSVRYYHYTLRRNTDVAFPSPFVLHTRPSHPPYNFSTDLASPSPVVLLARPSRPPYFSSDVAFPSPFVLHTQPSHPPYNFSTDLVLPSPLACWLTDRTSFPRRCNRKLLIEVLREVYSPVVLKFGWPRKDTELMCELCLQCSNLLDLLGEGVLGLRTESSKMNFALVRCSKAETYDGTTTWHTSLILATVWLAYLYLFKRGFGFFSLTLMYICRCVVNPLRHCSFYIYIYKKLNSKAIPVRAWMGPETSKRLRLPDLKTFGT